MARASIAARLAWRDLMGHRRRFTLSVALFSLPIACIVAFFTLISSERVEYPDIGEPATSISLTNTPCNDDSWAKNKDWCLSPDHADRADLSDKQRISDALGHDPELISKVYASLSTYATISANGEQASSDMVSKEVNPSGPKPGEVLLDKDFAELLGVSPGDTVTITVPVLGNLEEQKELSLVVAGFSQTQRNVANYEDLSRAIGITDSARDSELGRSAHLSWRSDERMSITTEPGMGISVSSAERGSRSGTVVGEARGLFSSPENVVVGVVVLVLLLLLVAAIIGPIFAVSARRKRRMLGLYASIGASPSDVRNTVLMEGIIVSCIGYILGLVLSLPVFYAVTLLPGIGVIHLQWAWDVALVLLPAVFVSGVGAALIPAVWVGTENPVHALADGASRRMRRFHWMMALPLLLFIPIMILAALPQHALTSVWWNLAGIAAILCAPLMVWVVARCGTVLPLPGKLAARDALRNIHRTAPAVAAVAGTVYSCAMLLGVMGSGMDGVDAASDADKNPARATQMVAQTTVDTATPRPYEQDVRAIREHYDVNHQADVYELSTSYGEARTLLTCAYGDQSNLPQVEASTESEDSILFSSITNIDSCMVIAEPDYLDIVASLHPDQVTPEQLAAAKQALADGKAVVGNTNYIRDGKVRVDMYRNSDIETGYEISFLTDDGWTVNKKNTDPESTTLLDAAPLNNNASPVTRWGTPILITPETARKLGADIVYTGSVFELSEPLSLVELIRVELGAPHGVRHMTVTLPGASQPENLVILLPEVAMSGALTIGVVLLIVFLAAAESRSDMEAMAALGAPKSLVRRYAGAQGMVVGLAGAVAGTLCLVIPGTVNYLSNVQLFGRFAHWDLQYIEVYGLFLLFIVGLSWLAGALFGVRSVSDYPRRR